MKKQAVCEYCGMIFEDRETNDNEDYYNYKQDCVAHEITHLDLNNKFKSNLIEALLNLDKKYNTGSVVLSIEVSACWDSYYGKDITYDFQIKNTNITKTITHKIEVPYDKKEKIPTVTEIISSLEHHYFIPTINNKYEGIFKFEDWSGGDGADDYMIGESYMKTIFGAFKNKKVRIEVIE